ncbi:MAG: biotin--[acetyl-CoA-carboxylase] ligase [Pseudobdellovibrionaceae bacterium]
MTVSSWAIERYEALASTQDEAKSLNANGLPRPFAVVADRQLQGRGRQGNTWDSPKGNLYTTLCFDADAPREAIGHYAFVVAVAAAQAIEATLGDTDIPYDLRLKWPNDILIDGRKVAGILLETDTGEGGGLHIYAGIGINFAPQDDPMRISLSACAGENGTLDIEAFLHLLLHQIDAQCAVYKEQGFAEIREEWLVRAYRLGKTIRARTPKSTQEGIFEGLDADGALLMTLDNGDRTRITAGEVFFPETKGEGVSHAFDD